MYDFLNILFSKKSTNIKSEFHVHQDKKSAACVTRNMRWVIFLTSRKERKKNIGNSVVISPEAVIHNKGINLKLKFCNRIAPKFPDEINLHFFINSRRISNSSGFLPLFLLRSERQYRNINDYGLW